MKPLNTTGCWLGLVMGMALFCAPLYAQETKFSPADDTHAYFQALLSQFNSDKVATYNQVLKLSPQEAEKFWPIYRNYEKEMAALADRRLDLLRDFFTHYADGQLTDKAAADLAKRWLRNLKDRTALWKKYNRQISKAVSPVRGAQFLQLEHEIALFIDLSTSSEIPGLTPATSSAAPK